MRGGGAGGGGTTSHFGPRFSTHRSVARGHRLTRLPIRLQFAVSTTRTRLICLHHPRLWTDLAWLNRHVSRLQALFWTYRVLLHQSQPPRLRFLQFAGQCDGTQPRSGLLAYPPQRRSSNRVKFDPRRTLLPSTTRRSLTCIPAYEDPPGLPLTIQHVDTRCWTRARRNAA